MVLDGPHATVIAAAVAAFVATVFGWMQFQIAKSQRDIALDKLNFDLFERRYQIYQATKALLAYVAQQSDFDKVDRGQILKWKIELQEASFFFDQRVVAFLADVEGATDEFLKHLAERESINIDNDAAWRANAEKLTEDSIRIGKLHADAFHRFKLALSFRQLTRLK